jgi:hypothetical protein
MQALGLYRKSVHGRWIVGSIASRLASLVRCKATDAGPNAEIDIGLDEKPRAEP